MNREGKRKMGIAIGVILVLVAFFQMIWPSVYPALLDLNQNPTAEYLRIMWLLSPNGLSVITLLLGCVYVAWVAYTLQ